MKKVEQNASLLISLVSAGPGQCIPIGGNSGAVYDALLKRLLCTGEEEEGGCTGEEDEGGCTGEEEEGMKRQFGLYALLIS